MALTTMQKRANLVNVKFQKKGNWKQVGMVAHKIASGEHKKKAQEAIEEIADLFLDTLKDWEKHPNAVPLLPLSIVTIGMKRARGSLHAEDAWLDTGYLIKHLRKWTEGRGDKKQWYVGAKSSDIHKPSGLRMAELIRWLEYGTKKIPSRPLFRLTYLKLEYSFDAILQKHQVEIARYMTF